MGDIGSFISEASLWLPARTVDSAWTEHAPFAFWLMQHHRPRILVELGTHSGFSFLVFCQAIERLALPARAYAVDTWKGDEHAALYGEEVLDALRKYQTERYSAFSQLVRSTFDDALARFEDRSVDLLHIDGRHFFEDVRHDFDCWMPKLSDRAVVLFHDTSERQRGFGVFRLWADIVQRYPHFEFVHGYGLGVLGVGTKLPPEVRALFDASDFDRQAEKVRDLYARLGGYLTECAMRSKAEAAVASALEVRARLATESAGKDADLRERIDEMSDLRAQIDNIHRSWSWRLTAPLRRIRGAGGFRASLSRRGRAAREPDGE